ncbi:MAG: phosphate acyltransferase, partial [Sphingopyxis sp.]
VFLGLNGVVLKSHGSANDKGVANAIHVCAKLLEKDIVSQVQHDLAGLHRGEPHRVAGSN